MAAPTELAPLRVSCPVCRQPIHPIAGRCRHCRSVLTRPTAVPVPDPSPTSRRPRPALIAALLVTIAIAVVVPLTGA